MVPHNSSSIVLVRNINNSISQALEILSFRSTEICNENDFDGFILCFPALPPRASVQLLVRNRLGTCGFYTNFRIVYMYMYGVYTRTSTSSCDFLHLILHGNFSGRVFLALCGPKCKDRWTLCLRYIHVSYNSIQSAIGVYVCAYYGGK